MREESLVETKNRKCMDKGTSLVIPVAENLPCNVGDSGSSPGWGIKIPHAETTAACVLSPWITTKIQQTQKIFFKKGR